MVGVACSVKFPVELWPAEQQLRLFNNPTVDGAT